MVFDLRFADQIFDSVVGGRSAVDIPRLDVRDLNEAHEFVKTYGYDLSSVEDLQEVWLLHRRAISIMRDRLLDPGEVIPDILTDATKLKDPAYLLVYASTLDHKNNIMQGWSCAILRVMHVLAHLEDDFFNVFSDQIRETIFSPFQAHIATDPVSGVTLGLRTDREQIKLQRYDFKNMKSVDSAAIKLLTKPGKTALEIYDKVAVRFVTKNLFDSFRVVRFLVNEHLISFPNIMPDQARNNLYPLNLFLEVIEEVQKEFPQSSAEEIDIFLKKKLNESLDRAEFIEKRNDFSGKNFRAIKFIA